MLVLLTTTLFGSVATQGNPNGQAATSEQIRRVILQKEDDQNMALLNNDATVLGDMCAEELAWTNASGILLSKAQMLADLRSGKQKNSTIVHEDVKLHVYGTTVVVTGISKSTYHYNGKEFVGARRFTNVWIKQGEAWLLVVHHVTPMSHDGNNV
jgi:ketosteroid isomerase-like protein